MKIPTPVLVPWLAAALVVLAGVGLVAGCAAPDRGRVLVLGLDGMDPQTVDLLMSEGKMPHFARLRQDGAYGRFRSQKPLLSPIIWTTIATGRSDEGHGIFDFTEVRFPGMRCGVQRLHKEPVLTPPSYC